MEPLSLSDFDFELPEASIARFPAQQRDGSRLMVLRRSPSSGEAPLSHHRFDELPGLLRPGDLVLANDSRVLKARLRAKKETGGRVEVLLVEPLPQNPGQWRVMLSGAKSVRPGARLTLAGDGDAPVLEVLKKEEEGFAVVALPEPAEEIAERYGQLPLPPYLGRTAQDEDLKRYQTIFARDSAQRSVAAPTAGLHFSREILKQLARRGIEWNTITLHVGPGTFLPVRGDSIESHRMHAERFEVSASCEAAITRNRAAGGRTVAVGTTVTRTLESLTPPIRATSGTTDVFIKPGFEFRSVDVLLTNFHLPRSTLLMLVSAFAGRDRVIAAYEEAVREGYRFYSYGDAMLIL